MKILLVEDSRAVSALMAARLQAFGHEVRVAQDGAAAVEAFDSCACDLILMDSEMPLMNGFEAALKIRALEATEAWARTPIIFLTASDTPDNLVTAIEAGGDDFIAKSVPEAVLQAKMKAMSRIASLRQRLSVANRKLEEMASRDGLTGLSNRRHMDISADLAWAQATRAGNPFGLLMMDIDNFKKYNDRYGHQVGDDCLRTVANAIAATVDSANAEGLGGDAFAARYGGEEFAVIIPGASEGACRRLGSAIVEAVRKLAIAHDDNDGRGVVTMSVGGSRVERVEGALVNLFRSADAQLYRVKEGGRDRYAADD